MQTPPTIAPGLLDRYLNGTCTLRERALVEQALENIPETRRILEPLIQRLGARESAPNVDAMWDIARQRILRDMPVLATSRTVRSAPEPGERSLDRNGSLRVRATSAKVWASAFAIALVLTLVVVPWRARQSAAAGITRTYTTGPYQEASVVLNDGTRARLSPNTTVRLVDFGGATRTVNVDGRVHFDVTHQTGHPFIIRSGDVTAEVLGTSFFVRHDAGASRVRIAVSEGKVRLRRGDKTAPGVILGAGEIGDVVDSTVHVSTVDDIAPHTESRPDRLFFRNVTVADIVAALSRWYGYQFRFSDHRIAEQKVNMGVSTQSPAAAFADLERVLRVNLTVVGDTVTLAPEPARRTRGMPRSRVYEVWEPKGEIGR